MSLRSTMPTPGLPRSSRPAPWAALVTAITGCHLTLNGQRLTAVISCSYALPAGNLVCLVTLFSTRLPRSTFSAT